MGAWCSVQRVGCSPEVVVGCWVPPRGSQVPPQRAVPPAVQLWGRRAGDSSRRGQEAPMGAAGVPASVAPGVEVGVAVLSRAPSPGRDVTAGVAGVTVGASRVATGASGVTTGASGVVSPGALYTWALTTAKSSTRSRFAAFGSSGGGGRRTWGATKWGKNPPVWSKYPPRGKYLVPGGK